MITFTKKQKEEFLAADDAVKAAANYLMNNYAITDIVESLAQALINTVAKCAGHSDIKITRSYYATLKESTVIKEVTEAFNNK